MLEEGDRIAARITFHYTGPSGESKTSIGFEILRVAGGKVVELCNAIRLG